LLFIRLHQSGFEAVERNGAILTVDVNNISLGKALQDLVRPIVWRLQGSAYCIMSYKNMGA